MIVRLKEIPKKLLISSLLTLTLISLGHAGETTSQAPLFPKLKLDWRMDLIKENVQTNEKGKTLSNEEIINREGEDLRFIIPYVRLDLSGKFNASTSYRAKFRLNETSAKNDPNIDDTGKFLDYAYIDYSILPNFYLKLGKQVFLHGGWEAMPSSRDAYSFSFASFSSYRTGVGAFYTFQKDHKFNFQVLNNSFGESNQRTFLYGGGYQGLFIDGLLAPIISFHVDPRTSQVPKSGATTTSPSNYKPKKSYYFAIGNRFSFGNYKFDLDYLHNKEYSLNSVIKNVNDSSLVGTLFYQYENFKPQVKFAYSRIENLLTGKKYGDQYDYHTVLEYYPNLAEDLRFHIGYVARDFKATNPTQSEQTKLHNKTYFLGLAGSF